MNAIEARMIAYNRNVDATNSQYSEIMNIIERYAKGGSYSCTYGGQIKDDVRIKLTEDGFKVSKTQYDRNEYYTEIDWK